MEAPQVSRMNGPAALRRAADVIEATAHGERVDAGLVLIARLAERYARGLAFEDEAAALVGLLRG